MEEIKYNLFLDDIRMPEHTFSYTNNEIYKTLDWVIVRSYNEFIAYINENGLPDTVSFDHDLADEHYAPEAHWDEKYNKWAEEQKFQEKTGYDCVKWMVDYCIDNGNKFPNWYLHTMNLAGKINMETYILNYLKHCEV